MPYAEDEFPKKRRSASADAAFLAEMERVSRMTVRERMEAACSMREQFGDLLETISSHGRAANMSKSESILRAAERVASILAGRDVPAVVIGAMALAAHGYIRFTKDIDLAVLADVPTMRSIADTLRTEGFAVEFHPPDADDPSGGMMGVSGPFGWIQIVSFADRFPAVIRDSLAAENTASDSGSGLRVAPIAQLVALKLYAGGTRSHADIIELLRRNPDADLEQIRETCRRYRLKGLDRLLDELD